VSLRIEPVDPQGEAALGLLREAAVDARALYPELHRPDAPWPTNGPATAGSVYLIAWQNGVPLACGALRPLEPGTAEVRRMYVHRDHRRQGLALAVLDRLVAEARRLGLTRLRLETGHKQEPAMALYEAFGFHRIAPFGDHIGDPTSVCFELDLPTLNPMQLVRPDATHLPSYVAALRQGWSADNVRGAAAAVEELARIEADAAGFLAGMEDREAAGGPVTLPDGSTVPRLPGFRRWLWDEADGSFAGSIGLRWQQGTTALPPHCLGHIGYAVVPWKQRRGFATRGLALMLDEARAVGLPFVELTTDPDNLASQRVITTNGGVLVERFTKPAQFGHTPGLRYRIHLSHP
jgi:predicted acetyltransferase/GNAT superfamily N-acetyltransferase